MGAKMGGHRKYPMKMVRRPINLKVCTLDYPMLPQVPMFPETFV